VGVVGAELVGGGLDVGGCDRVGVGVTGGCVGWFVAGGVVPGCPGGRVGPRVVPGSSGAADDEDAESVGDSDGNEGASVTTVGGSRLASAPTGSAVPSPHAGGGPDAGSRDPFSDTEPDATSTASGSAVNRLAPAVSSGPASVSIRSESAWNADDELAVLASSRPRLIRTTADGWIGRPDWLTS
jgi:hypothetical protein